MSDSDLEPLILRGLDGANPLAFLATVGVLRVLTGSATELRPQLAWRVHHGAWRPSLRLVERLTEDELADRIFASCSKQHCEAAFGLGDNLSVTAEVFRSFAADAASAARLGEPVHAEFAAAFASEVTVSENGTVQDTALRTMSGAGHQHFLKTMQNLVRETTREHVEKALFRRWDYDDPVRNMSLRWDPADDSRYALRWSDPSGDPERQRSGAMWGANRLAIEGLPMFPVMPSARQLETTAFRTAGSRGTSWTWPIWEAYVGLDVVRSMLALKELQATVPDRAALSARGIVESFRSRRLTVGKFRNFTWGAPA